MYAEIAPKLFELGWRNILPLGVNKYGRPVPDSKGCYLDNWGERQRTPLTREGLERCVRRYPHAGVGCAFGPSYNLVAVDVDIEDQHISGIASFIAAGTLPFTKFIRVGKRPKYLLLYRGNVRTMRPPGLGVEIFGHSCQTALFAIHPKTQKPYEWVYGWSPLHCRPQDLPLIEQSHIDEFLAVWKTTVSRFTLGRGLGRYGFSGHRGGSTEALDFYIALQEERRFDGDDAAARQLDRMNEGERHKTINSVIGYLVATRRTDNEIVEFVDEWFPQHCRTDEWSDPRARARKAAKSTRKKFEADDDLELKE